MNAALYLYSKSLYIWHVFPIPIKDTTVVIFVKAVGRRVLANISLANVKTKNIKSWFNNKFNFYLHSARLSIVGSHQRSSVTSQAFFPDARVMAAATDARSSIVLVVVLRKLKAITIIKHYY